MGLKRYKLISIVRALFVGFTVIMTVVLIFFQILQFEKNFSESSIKMRKDYISRQKMTIKNEVMQVVGNIRYQQTLSETTTKNIVKEQVYEAYSIAENIYKCNKKKYSKKKIKRMILEALRPIRYHKEIGYFFITRLDGVEILFADKPEMEGLNMLKMRDIKGKYVIKDMISLINKSNEGFYSYYWTKPGEKGYFKKISFIKKFKPFNWFIGSGLYENDIETETKKKLLGEICRIRFGKEGYLFINKLNGDTLISNGSVYDGTKKLWQRYKDPVKTKNIFKLEYNAAMKKNGDYIYYNWQKLTNSNVESPKISYIYGVPEWDWLIGAGVYVDDIEVEIAKLQKTMWKNLHRQIVNSFFVIVLIFLFFILLFHLFSKRLLRDLNLFVKFFKVAVTSGHEIDRNKIRFEELFHIANDANKMLIEKKEAKKRLLDEKEQLSVTLRSIGDAVIATDTEGKITLVNEVAVKLTGWKEEEAIGIYLSEVFKIINSETKEIVQNHVSDVLSLDNNVIFEQRLILISRIGNEYFIDEKAAPIRTIEGKVRGVVFVFRDVTKECKINDRLREMATIVEQSEEGISIADLNGYLKYVNNAWADMHGYPDCEQLIGKNLSIFHTQEQLKSDVEPFNKKVIQNGYNVGEVGHMRKDGTIFLSSMAVTLLKNEKNVPYGFAGFMQDLSELKKMGKDLAESEKRYKALFDAANNSIFLMKDGIFVDCNPRTLEMFGVTKKDILGKKPNQFSPEFQPDGMKSYDKGKEKIQATLEGNPQSFRWQHSKLDETLFDAEVSLTLVDLPTGPHILAIVQDITKRKEAENEILKLRKLESIGVLAGGIAHDFNNLLTGIFGNLEMAKLHLSSEHKSYKYLESAEHSMDNAANLTKQLLTFSKGGDPIKEALSIGEIIKETAKFSLRGSNVKLKCEIANDLWVVEADKGQISQVIGNLVINAQQAMPMGGTVTVFAENLKVEGMRMVKIEVRDEGVGIAPQYLEKIFDPYFTTKQQGNGLGLATTYSIITKHNGTISAFSTLNEGTVFSILLPASNKVEIKGFINKEEIFSGSSSVSADILVLDDEEIVRNVIGDMLELMGFKVSFAVEGREAVKMYKESVLKKSPFDAVITDLTIPGGMGGQDATIEILKLNPEAKVIVSSGYATDPVVANFQKYGFVDRVVKPYRFKELQRVIERVLSL